MVKSEPFLEIKALDFSNAFSLDVNTTYDQLKNASDTLFNRWIMIRELDPITGKIRAYASGEEISSDEFGRIAAQTAKQVIFQKIREAEIEIRYKAQISCRGAFKAQFKSVSLWICGV